MLSKNLIFGLDPGTTSSGWAIYDESTNEVLDYGHDTWDIIRDILKNLSFEIKAVCIEKVIMHSGLPPSKYIMNTAIQVGRIHQICDDQDMAIHELKRIDICEKVTGIRPKRGVKVTKKDVQESVKNLLGINSLIKPQHANDAVAAILAEYSPYV